jgi:hypothetical protein
MSARIHVSACLAWVVVSPCVCAQSPPGSRALDHDPGAWRDAPELPGRTNSSVAYDERRDRIVLFGGSGVAGHATALGDQRETWEWDGASWRRRAIDGPPGREFPDLAYDPVRERVILFGGLASDRSGYDLLLGDTWEWDGREWRELHPAHRPPARYGSVMATDPVRKRVLLFGGYLSPGLFGQVANDSWEWDGSDWTQRFPVNAPTPRAFSAMAWCAASGRLVLYGGGGFGGGTADTWEWSGSDWVALQGATGPPPLAGHGMAAERTSGGVLMLAASSTWLWSGSAWSQITGTQPTPQLGKPTTTHGPRARIWYSALEGRYPTLAETWEWTPSGGWVVRAAEERFLGGVGAYDAARDETVFVTPLASMRTVVRTEEGYRLMQPPVSPPSRTNFALVYHSGRRQILLYGGNGKNDLWAWDGATWAEIVVSGPRPPATDADLHLAYDNARDKLVVVPYLFENELWEWDANGWRKSIPSPAHTATFACLGYDIARSKLVLFGLVSGGGSAVWEFEAAGWVHKPTGARQSGCRVTYVPFLDGLAGVSSGNRVLVWNGERWSDVPPVRPPGYSVGPLVYDAGRQRLWSFLGGLIGPDAWYLERRTLEAPPYVRPGEALTFDFDLPEAAHDFAVLAFARSTYPGIPLIEEPGLGWKRLPLAFDDLLQASLSAPIVLQLNGLGRRQYAFQVPDVPAFVGLRFFAAGVTLRASGGFGSITNVVDLEAGR